MNSFGLGLILNFTDNATAGMRSATQAFQQMSSTVDAVSSSIGNSMTNMVSACYALDSVGSTIMGIGTSIVSSFLDISQEAIDTGMTMQGFRMQLQALYGENAFESKMKQIQEYARDSVFEVEGLMQAIVTMKAVGVEAMEAVTSSSGNTTQTLMDYASDIAAMFPNMRNAYGTGVNAAMGALKEYIAEGNALSLKRGAGLDITGLLGEDIGDTLEERTQQIADLVEQLGIAGYTVSLLGTPTQQLSKMQDVLFNTMSDIADSGVFDRYTQLLTKVADWLTTLSTDTDKYSSIVSIAGETITSVLEPLESILDRLISKADALIDWAVANPTLAKNILLTVAALGAFLIVGGMFLKFTSALGMASVGFDFLKSLPSLLKTVASGFGTLIWKALPFIALAGLAYYAWTENLFGIRDAVNEAIQEIKDIFTVLGDAWDDFTLSEENYNLAETLGILPLVESLLQLKYYWEYFSEGFVKGFNEFFHTIEDALGDFGIDVSDIFVKIGEFLSSLVDIGQEDKWSKIGEVAGKLAGVAISVLAIVKVLSILKPLLGLFKGGIPFLGGGGVKPVASPTATLKNLGNMAMILVGLGGVLAALGLISMIPFSIPRVLQVIAVVGIIGVLGAALTGIASLIGAIPVVTVSLGLANIAIIMGGLTALFVIMGLASSVASPAQVLAVVAVVTVLGVLGAVLTGLAALIGLIPFPVVLAGIANIALVLGALTGLAVLISEALPTIGENINQFVTSLEPAFKAFQMLQGLDMAGIGSFFDSFGSFMLKVTGDTFASFFTGSGNLSGAAQQLVDFATISKTAFDTFAQIDVGSATSLLTVIRTIESAGAGVPGVYGEMYSAIQTCVDNSMAILTNFASQGTSIGRSLMEAIASGVAANAGVVKSAISSALSGISVTASPSVTLNIKPQVNWSGFVGLSTGGYVKESGLAVLHPNEVVVNDETTRKLNEFLNQQSEDSSGSSQSGSNKGETHNDYSVTFSAGSVVIQLSNSSDSELEKAADKLMRIIERKQQLKSMATRA